MMNIEAEVRDIKQRVIEISKKIDDLMYEREITAMMKLSEVDILITKDHTSFRKAGLKVDSVIKLDKIATVLKDLIVGELGEVDEKLRQEVNQKLKRIMEI